MSSGNAVPRCSKISSSNLCRDKWRAANENECVNTLLSEALSVVPSPAGSNTPIEGMSAEIPEVATRYNANRPERVRQPSLRIFNAFDNETQIVKALETRY